MLVKNGSSNGVTYAALKLFSSMWHGAHSGDMREKSALIRVTSKGAPAVASERSRVELVIVGLPHAKNSRGPLTDVIVHSC